MDTLIIDLETAPLPNAADYLDPVEAAKNLVDPVKIAADLEKRKRAQLEDCGLDWNLNRIVCAGLWNVDHEPEPTIIRAIDEQDERMLLCEIAAKLDPPRPLILGFAVRRFDVPVILQRARYLGVKMPRISMRPYDNPHITDLFDVLTFDGQQATSIMRRSLTAFCRRFGIAVADDFAGKDVTALIADGEWDAVADHCRADMRKTFALAKRLGYVQAREHVGAF